MIIIQSLTTYDFHLESVALDPVVIADSHSRKVNLLTKNIKKSNFPPNETKFNQRSFGLLKIDSQQ